MKLYLARHGEYSTEEFGRIGSLSDKGINEIEEIAKIILPSHLNVSDIFHSGKRRAEQTAQLLAKAFESVNGVKVYSGINPEDDVKLVVKEIDAWREDVLLVGHLPFMSRLLSYLIVKDENKEIVIFKPGTIVALEKINHTQWIINWMLSPDLLSAK